MEFRPFFTLFFGLVAYLSLPLGTAFGSEGGSKAQELRVFAVHFNKGPRWNHTIEYRYQPTISEHQQFTKNLFNTGAVHFVGENPNRLKSLLLLKAIDIKEAKLIISKNPAIQERVLTYKVEEMHVRMSRPFQ